MLLINIVMFIVVQEILVDAEISKGENALRLLEEVARARWEDAGNQALEPPWIESLRPVIKSAGFSCFVIIRADRQPVEGGEQCRQKNELVRLAETVAEKGGVRISSRYSIRDIFWQQAH